MHIQKRVIGRPPDTRHREMAPDDVPFLVKLQAVPLPDDFQLSDESAVAFFGAVCEYQPQYVEEYSLDPTGDDCYKYFEETMSVCAAQFLKLQHDARLILSADWQHLQHDRE